MVHETSLIKRTITGEPLAIEKRQDIQIGSSIDPI